jgi:hypothetical protein
MKNRKAGRNLTYVKVKDEPNFHPNTSFEFTDSGMTVSVSLNIEPEMIKYMAPGAIFKGKDLNVFRVSHHMKSKEINKDNVRRVQDWLLRNCMTAAREAKIAILNQELSQLKQLKIWI